MLEGYASRLERLTESHLAARAADLRDIETRYLDHLIGERPESFQDALAAPAIVLTHDLSPSEAAGLDPGRVPRSRPRAGAAPVIPRLWPPRWRSPPWPEWVRFWIAPVTVVWRSWTATRDW